MYTELPYIAFIAAVIVLVPLPWHWRARNIATLSIIAWLFVVNVIYGVDAIVWKHSVDMVIPVWCDITARVLIGSTIGLPAACMCVCIALERVASVREVKTTTAAKRRRQLFEAFCCFGLPAIWMGLHIIVQGHRFDILENYGCRPTTYVSIPSIFLIWVPPLAFSTVGLVYAAIALSHFWRRRISFAKHLQNSNSGLTTSRYLRLMLMSLVLMCQGVAANSITLWFNSLQLRPWTGWDDVHWNFSRIDLYALLFMPQQFLTYYYVLWWIPPISSFTFFVFFAFSRDAIVEYTSYFIWVRKHVKYQPRKKLNGISSLPSFRSQPYNGAVSRPSLPNLDVGSSTSCSQPVTPTSPDSKYPGDLEIDATKDCAFSPDHSSPHFV